MEVRIMRCIKAVTPTFMFKKLARPLFLAVSRTKNPRLSFIGQSKPLFERINPPPPLYWSLLTTTRISESPRSNCRGQQISASHNLPRSSKSALRRNAGARGLPLAFWHAYDANQ
jgi:hypothetical protein